MKKYDLKSIEEKLNRCKNVKLEDVSLDDVDELGFIKIDKRKSKVMRILDFLTKVKNPYIFKVKGKLVKMSFSENSNLTADDCLTRVLKNLYR